MCVQYTHNIKIGNISKIYSSIQSIQDVADIIEASSDVNTAQLFGSQNGDVIMPTDAPKKQLPLPFNGTERNESFRSRLIIFRYPFTIRS